eukprot:3017538-Heterocapsa_arctica.AAC.1
MAFDPDLPHERAGFKFFKRCDNIYTIEGCSGTFREHPIEVHGTTVKQNGGGNRRGSEAVQDKLQNTQIEKGRLDLGRVRRDLGLRRGTNILAKLPDARRCVVGQT